MFKYFLDIFRKSELNSSSQNQSDLGQEFDASSIYFYSNNELGSVAPQIFKLFGIPEYDRDYENLWEWFENDSNSSLHLNISRTHNWDTGNYGAPIIIRIRRNQKAISRDETISFAQKLSETLKASMILGVYRSRTKTAKESLETIKLIHPIDT